MLHKSILFYRQYLKTKTENSTILLPLDLIPPDHLKENRPDKNLNLDVDFMKGKMASTEVLAIAIWEELETGITDLGATLHNVKVQETENNFVEYFGK